MLRLSKHQIGYILENIHKKSKKEIAKDLGIEKRVVSKFMKGLDKDAEIKPPATSQKAHFANNLVTKIAPQSWTVVHICSIFLIALIIRVIYIHQLSHTYFFSPFEGGFDDYVFDNWAGEILKGNWLGDKTIYIYRMPLCAYFLSLIYSIFGHSYWAAYIIQSFIGAITCVLIYLIGKMLFTRSVGLIAGIIAALYSPFIFYSGMLVGETLGIFIVCLAFLFLLLFQKTRKLYYLFPAGLSIGLSMLIRGNILIMLPFIFLWLFMIYGKRPILARSLPILVFVIGVFLSISPVLLRNYFVEKDVVPIVASGGLNIYIGNAYGADGKFRAVESVGGNLESMLKNSVKIAEKSAGRKLKPSAVSNFWVRETLKSISANGTLFIFPLIAKKFALFWNSYELPDIWDFYFFKLYIPLFNFPLTTFLFIAPLSFMAMYLTWPKRKELSLLYIFIFGYMLSLLITFITARYKTQAIPFLIILASYAVVQFKDLLTRDRNKLIICISILIGGFLFCNIPFEKISFETSLNSLGIVLKRTGKIEEAIAAYKKAIEIAPGYPSPYYNLGILYRDTGQYDLARAYFLEALRVAPDFEEARQKLAELPAG